jgi:hypothetical protein
MTPAIKVHVQNTGVRTACGIKVFPHDWPTRLVLKAQALSELKLDAVTCKICLSSTAYRWAKLEEQEQKQAVIDNKAQQWLELQHSSHWYIGDATEAEWAAAYAATTDK